MSQPIILTRYLPRVKCRSGFEQLMRLLLLVTVAMLCCQSASFGGVTVVDYHFPGAIKLLEQKSSHFPDSVESRIYLVGFNQGYTEACGKRQTHAIDPTFGINWAKYLATYRPAPEGIADAQKYLSTHDCQRAFPLIERATEEEVAQAQRDPNPEDRAKFQLLTQDIPDPVRTQAVANWWQSLLGKWVDEKLGVRMTFYVEGGSKMANLGGESFIERFATPDFGGGDIMTTVTDAASGAQAVFYDCTDEIRLRVRAAWCQSRDDNHKAEATRNADGTLDVAFRGFVAWKNSWSQSSFHLVRQQSDSSGVDAAVAAQKQKIEERKRFHPDPPPVSDLIKCVGLNGLLTKPEDIEKWKVVCAELLRRANLGNYEAMYALGKEAEYPSVQGTKPNWNDAAFWYGAGTNRNDHRAEYHLGRMYENNLVPGVRDPIRGRTLMMDAEKKGYLTSTDSIDTSDHSTDAVVLLGALAAWMAAVQGGSTAPSYPSPNSKHCLIKSGVMVGSGPNRHWQDDSYWAYGSSCP